MIISPRFPNRSANDALSSQTAVDIVVAGKKMSVETGLFINNQFVKAKSGKTFPTVNPATGEVIAEVQEALKEDVDDAVKAAQVAFRDVWSKTSGAERGKMLWKLAELVDANAQDLANLEALDMGKTAAMAAGMDVPGVASCLRYYAGWADKIHGKVGWAVRSTIPGNTKLTSRVLLPKGSDGRS